MEARAQAKYTRVTPRKARLVADLIRGRMVEEALTVLTFTRKGAARQVRAVLKSAVANASQNPSVDLDTLRVKEAYVDEGPSLKRWRPRAMGRAARVTKRTSHITIVVEEG